MMRCASTFRSHRPRAAGHILRPSRRGHVRRDVGPWRAQKAGGCRAPAVLRRVRPALLQQADAGAPHGHAPAGAPVVPVPAVPQDVRLRHGTVPPPKDAARLGGPLPVPRLQRTLHVQPVPGQARCPLPHGRRPPPLALARIGEEELVSLLVAVKAETRTMPGQHTHL